MAPATTPDPTVTVLSPPADRAAELAADVRAGLASHPRTLPAKWLYDARGSRLFEDITRLDAYYPTRTEAEILDRVADEVVAVARPEELVELGSGSSRKTRRLLGAMHRLGTGRRYVPLDVSASAIRTAAEALGEDLPWLEVRGYVADFLAHLDLLPASDGRRLLAFLGSTLGNLDAAGRATFLATVAAVLGDGDHFLLGADLVKDPEVLLAAYDDPEGVTAAFNRNLLRVLNRELDGDLPVEAFGHDARWNAEEERMELWLTASRPVAAQLARAGVGVTLAVGEGIRSEISSKFTRARLEREVAAAGLRVVQFHTDERNWYAVVLLARAA